MKGVSMANEVNSNNFLLYLKNTYKHNNYA